MPSPRRDQLVETALTLFAKQGYHATGIDKILADAGVAKMTLYKHFKSKEELILAVLRLRDERFRNHFMRAVERRGQSARERILVMFDVLKEWITSDQFHGCMFINACAEFSSQDDPIHTAAAEHKRLIQGYIEELLRSAGTSDSEALALQLCALIEGATVIAQVTGQAAVVGEARTAAEVLFDHAVRATSNCERDPAMH